MSSNFGKVHLYTRVALTIVIGLLSANVAGAQSFRVSGAHAWLDTGISIRQGAVLELTASGQVNFPGAGAFGPKGTAVFPDNPEYLAQTAYRLGLVARLAPAGERPESQVRVDFDYGRQQHVSVPAEGATTVWRVWLAANGYSAGTGEYLVNVAVRAVPSASAITPAPGTVLSALTATEPAPDAPTGRFRVTINGFVCNSETYDNFFETDGKRDEVYFLSPWKWISSDGSILAFSEPRTKVMGDINTFNKPGLLPEEQPRVQAGTASDLGGIRDFDTFPTATPYIREGAAVGYRVPMFVTEVDLTRGGHALAVLPQIWEYDGGGDPLADVLGALADDAPAIVGAAIDIIAQKDGAGDYIKDALNSGLPALKDLYTRLAGSPGDRPIGTEPKSLLLTYDVANSLRNKNISGKGFGVLEYQFADKDGWGNYTIYVQIERIDQPPLPQAARFLTANVPSQMTTGKTYPVSVTMQNTGDTVWSPTALHRLGSQSPQDNMIWGLGRVDVPAPIPPGGQATFSFTVIAPSVAGSYPFQWRMVEEGVEWFGDQTQHYMINVTAPPPPPPPVYDEPIYCYGAKWWMCRR